MAHFAKLGVNGKVIAVHGLDNDQMLNADGQEDESVGQQRLQQIHGWPAEMWIQTSYNTRDKKYINQDGSEDASKQFRGNYAGIGYTWDEDNQIFWAKQPFASWTKNISTANWDAPITTPNVLDYDHPSDVYTDEDTNLPEGKSVGDPKLTGYLIYWDEDAYQADNNTGWKAKKHDDSVVNWNGSAWV